MTAIQVAFPFRWCRVTFARLTAVATCLCLLPFATTEARETPYPGTLKKLSNGWEVYVPQGADVLRGMMIDEDGIGADQVNHDASQLSALWRFAWVKYTAETKTTSKAATQAVFDEAASATGHPELKHAPFTAQGGSRNSGFPDDLAGWFPSRTIAILSGQPGSDFKSTPASVPCLGIHEEGSSGKIDGIDAMQAKYKDARASGRTVTYAPQWGWGHGGYSMRDFAFPWFDHIIGMRLSENADPRNGEVSLKTVDDKSGWLGDPSTWNGLSPKIYKYSEYPGDKSKASWLPDAYIAGVWRAYVSRHPSETQQDQGEGHVGGAASTYRMRGQANLMIQMPSRPYHLAKLRGENYPVVPVGTKVQIAAGPVGKQYFSADSVTFLDGDAVLKRVPGNAYNLYSVVHTYTSPGVKALSARVKLKDGSVIHVRPALTFVHPVAKFKVELDSTVLGDKDIVFSPKSGAGTYQNPGLVPWNLGLETPGWAWGSNLPVARGSYDGNTFTLTGNGHGMYWCWDRATMGIVSEVALDGDFTFTARVADMPENGVANGSNFFGMVGIAVKGAADTRAPVLSLRWDYFWQNQNGNGLVWFNRFAPSAEIGLHDQGEKGCNMNEGQGCLGKGHENLVAGFNKREDLWLRVKRVRSGEVSKYYLFARYGASGEWKVIDPVTSTANPCGGTVVVKTLPYFLVPEDRGGLVTVGPMISSGIYGASTLTAKFDNISVDVEQSSSISRNVAQQSLGEWIASVRNGSLHFKAPGDEVQVGVSLFDVEGRQLLNATVAPAADGSIAIPVEGKLKSGTYMLKIRYSRNGNTAMPLFIP